MTKGERAVEMREGGFSNKQIAEELGMQVKSVRRLISETKAFRAFRRSQTEFGSRIEVVRGALDAEAGVRISTPDPKPRRHFVIPDTQCKPGVPLDHLLWAGEYAAEVEPDVIIHLGDHWDMASLSSYEKRGSKYFEGKRYIEDVAAGNKGHELFEEGYARRNGKHVKKVLLRGNHEDRLSRALNEDPRLEGVIGFHQFNDVEMGWEPVEFLVPCTIDDITYSHYFYRPGSGSPYSGSVDTMLRNIGFSFSMGHQQGLRWARRELPNGEVQIGLVAGSFYQHNEDYRGPQAAAEWRGVVVKNEVANGHYDPMFVSLAYLKRKFGQPT